MKFWPAPPFRSQIATQRSSYRNTILRRLGKNLSYGALTPAQAATPVRRAKVSISFPKNQKEYPNE